MDEVETPSSEVLAEIVADLREDGTEVVIRREEIRVLYVSRVIGRHGPQVKSVGPQSQPYIMSVISKTEK